MSETLTHEKVAALRSESVETLQAGRSLAEQAVESQYRGRRLSTQERSRLQGKARALGFTQSFAPVILFERLETLEAKLDQILALLTEPKAKR